ncbi:hypothetical protein NC652_039134 [Populus alba x Populus x berolinensis]|nr:hypothetical protein NC652_039134 [Populus alba x Populus x berolinensis]
MGVYYCVVVRCTDLFHTHSKRSTVLEGISQGKEVNQPPKQDFIVSLDAVLWLNKKGSDVDSRDVIEMVFPAQFMGFAQPVPLNLAGNGSQHHHKLIISMP